ncbi:MAG: SLBB domain-containing protein [Chloroflexi bacterium]|nr:SLBB domain-containing protein [Chloroflexota bacterium]
MSERYAALRAAACAGWDDRHGIDAERTVLRVDLSTSSIAAGADRTLAALRAAVAARRLDCAIVVTGTTGASFALPTVEVQRPGAAPVLYGPVPADSVGEFVAAVVAEGDPRARWALGWRACPLPFSPDSPPNEHADVPLRAEDQSEGVSALADHPFWRHQQRRLMRWMGVIDPESIDDALATGAYAGLDRALTMEPLAICDRVEEAGVGGRGGGGFPAGRKWKFLQGAPGPVKYMVCNADEGDPGAFVNRVQMESDPHALLEGMIIAGRATGAGYGYIYIRDEYPLSIARVQRAIDQARAGGLLGDDILGSGFAFDLEITRGAGSYVCGEETGLIASIEGLRGMPKIRPPFPAQRGVFAQPSNVNNVETYANVPLVLRHGAAWYREAGVQADAGTKMFSISGHIERPGVLEVPFGLPLSTLLVEAGGGTPDGRPVKGVQPGGPLGGILPAVDLDLPLERAPFSERSLLLGSGGLILFDDRTCVLDLALYFSEFCEDESCGRCTTCFGGGQRLVELLTRIAAGGGRDDDLDRIGAIDRTMQNANCLHGQFTPYAVRSVLRFFREELEAHARERRCPARRCRGLIRHRISAPDHPALAEAADLCPTDAIGGLPAGKGWAIDDARCIQCGLCRELAPAAVVVADRFASVASPRAVHEPVSSSA